MNYKHSKTLRNLAFLFLTLLIAAYANHFANTFHFDDFHTIVNNVHIRKISNIPQFFVDASMFSSSVNHQGLRPIVTTSLAIDYWIAGDLYPFMFHLSTFLWHITLCVLLFFLYRKLIGVYIKHKWVDYIALFGAGWFSIHTAMAETLNYIISRSDVLSTFFVLLSFYVFVALPTKRKWFLYVIPAIVAVFTKEIIPSLIVILFFYLLLFEKKLSIPDLFKRKNFGQIINVFVTLLPLIVAVGIAQLYTLSRMKETFVSYGVIHPYGYYWLTQTYVWFLYFKTFFLPTHLSADTDLAVLTTIWDIKAFIGIVFIFLFLYAIIKLSKIEIYRPIAFGLIWFAAALLPTSVTPLAEVMNDHRMYYAFTGLMLSVITALGIILIKNENTFTQKPVYKNVLFVVFGLLIAAHAFGVVVRNRVWRNDETLWYDVTIKSPNNGRGLMNYGLALMNRGNYAGAMEYYQRAQAITPFYNTLYVNMGLAAAGLNNHVDAEKYFNNAILFGSNDAASFSYYSRYLAQQGRAKEAIAIAQRALALNPNDEISLRALMSAYHQLSDWNALEKTANFFLFNYINDTEAIQYLSAAKNRRPKNDATATIKSQLKTADDFLNFSLIMYNAGNYQECINACLEVLKLDPNNANAYSNMCAAYNSLEQWDKGLEACKKALSIDPNHQMAQGNLQWSLKRKK